MWQYNHSGFLDKIDKQHFDENGGLLPIRSQYYIIGKFDQPWVENDSTATTLLYTSG